MEKNIFEDDLETTLKSLNKNILTLLLILLEIVFFVRGILRLITNSFESNYMFPLIIIMLLLFICLVINILSSSPKFNDISYLLMILFMNGFSIFDAYQSTYLMNEPLLGIRLIYISKIHTIILCLIRVDNSLLITTFIILIQTIMISIVMFLYGYSKDLYPYIFYDIIYYLINVSIIYFIFYLREIFIKRFKLLQNIDENFRKTNQNKNISNNSNNSLISINFFNNEIIFNQKFNELLTLITIDQNNDFIWFLKQYKCEENMGLEYLLSSTRSLFDEVDKELFKLLRNNHYINLEHLNILPESDDHFLEKFVKCNTNFPIKKLIFIKKLEILNFLFKVFVEENKLDTIKVNINPLEKNLSDNSNIIYKILKDQRSTTDFIQRGTFKYSGRAEENILEIYSKRNIYINNLDNSDSIDVIINDISFIRRNEMNRAHDIFRLNFLAKLSHELKTPINSMIFFIRQFVEKLKKNEVVEEEEIGILYSQANYITIIFQDINDYTKDNQDISLEISKVELKEVIDFSFSILKGLIHRKYMNLTVLTPILELDNNLPKYIFTDQRRIKQVLVNLLSNSCKSTNVGYIKMSVKIVEDKEIRFGIEYSDIRPQEMRVENCLLDSSELYNNDNYYIDIERPGFSLIITKMIIEKIGKNFEYENKKNYSKVSFSIMNTSENSQKNSEIYSYPTKLISNFILNKHFTEKFISLTCLLNTSHDLNNKSQPLKENQELSMIEKSYKFNSEISQIARNVQNEIAFDINDFRKSIDENQTKNLDIEIFIKPHIDPDFNLMISECYNSNKEFLKVIIENDNIIFGKYMQIYMLYSKSVLKYLRLNYNNEIKNKEHYFILVVDDEKLNAKSLKYLIMSYFKSRNINNYSTIHAQDGIEALFILLYSMNMKNNIKVLITDLNMNFMDGITLLEIVSFLTSKRLINYIDLSICSAQLLENANLFRSRNFPVHILNKPCSKKDIEDFFFKLRIL